MAKNLVVVESPAKAKTINKFLGNEFVVKASMGHVKDLPKSKLGVDPENNFEPHYITIRTRTKLLKELKALAKKSKIVYLATDPDREGEAIGWHLATALKDKNNEIKRIMFHEITKKAVQAAIADPQDIDVDKVNAQQARRILDRLVGYSLSPLLWKNVRRGLSAGRVQSVAVRLVVEREKEIDDFNPEEYWEVDVDLEAENGEFTASLTHIDGEKIEHLDGKVANDIAEKLATYKYKIAKVNRKKQKRNPQAPFTTSKMQQESARKLHFTAKKTMLIAQQLYEGIDIGEEGAVGMITYMRTDAVRVAEEAQAEAREYIDNRWGGEFLPEKPPVYKTKKAGQDAHEAIRPTSAFRDPKAMSRFLTPDQEKLYKLIWQRFMASQMTPAQFDATNVDVNAGDNANPDRLLLRASGSVMIFSGFTSVYTESIDEDAPKLKLENTNELPRLEDGEILKYLKHDASQHFTQPPPRFNDATLVKALEELEIGRPSTYAPIISTILDRQYVERIEGGRFAPTELGVLITGLLVKHFGNVLNVDFTANMEHELDKVEAGTLDWRKAVGNFYAPFLEDLESARDTMRNVKKEMEVETEVICEICDSKMVVKWGRHGKFLACPDYPKCKNTKPMEEGPDGVIGVKQEKDLDEECEECKKPLIYKQGRYGRFIACSGYPDCKYTRAVHDEIGMDCPKKCGGKVVQKRSRRGRTFYGCSSYPKCDFVSWGKPVEQKCPSCNAVYLTEKYSKKEGLMLMCATEGCDHKVAAEIEAVIGSAPELMPEPGPV